MSGSGKYAILVFMEAEGRQTPIDAIEALRRSEERYALAQRVANIGSWDWDIQTGDLHWSDRIEPIFGFAPGQFGATYEAFLECVHPDDRQGVVDSVYASVEQGDDYAIEHRIVWPDGTVRWVSETGDVIRDEQCRAIRMLGIVQDITERKNVEETLRRSEANYRTIFDSASDAIFVHDIDDAKILSVNEKACQMYGYTQDEFEQLTIEDLSTGMPPHVQEKAVRWIKKAVEEGPQLLEWMCRDKTGRQFWAEVNLKTAVIEDRKRVLAIVRDITERREVDEVIQENERLFRNLFENAGEALFLINPDGGGFVSVNQRACDALGYTREELLNMCVSDIDPVYSREKFAEFVRTLKNDEPVTLEASHKRKDGTTFPVEIRTGLIEIKRERRLLSMVRDISERKIARAERESLARFPSEDPNPVLRVADNGVLLYANDASESLVAEWGCRVGQVVPEQWCRTTSEVLASASSKRVEVEHEGRVFAFVVTPVAEADYVNLYGRDITERKDMEARQQLAGRILECLNRGRAWPDSIRDVLELVKDATGFDAVAIRYREGNDFPYLEVDGFPDDFVKAENYLCCHDEAGELIYDSQGRPVIECMCGNVLRGRTDPDQPFFTEGGSFWTNSTTELVARTPPEALQVPTRNQCNQAGYESVALIPLRSSDEIVGLLQLNDIRRGCFTSEMIHFLEEIGASIGIGMARIRAERELHLRNRIAEVFLTVADDRMYGEVLEILLQALASEYGFFGYIDQAGDLVCPSMTRDVWDRCKMADKTIVFPREAWGDSIWARAITSGKSQISNTPLKPPKGHVKIERVLNVPIVYDKNSVGVITLANKRSDYTPGDQKLLESTAGFIAPVLHAMLQRKRDLAEIGSLARFPSENPNPVLRIASDGTVLYANTAGSRLVASWGCKTGEQAPENWRRRIARILESGKNEALEAFCEDRIFSLVMAPVKDAGYANVYGSDVTERRRAQESLNEYRHHLEELVQTRTVEITQANEKLLQQIEERKRLEKEILNISEREQRRIGRELHDSIGQQFTGIAFMMKVLEQKLADKFSDEAAGAAEIKELVNQAMDQTRGLAKGLHPVDLDAGSLTAVLQELAATTEKMFGVRCALECDETVPIDDAEVATHLYRIAQEAITNAVKHGKAKNIRVELARKKDETVLTVENDGRDFPEEPESRGAGMGLHIMNHRADIIGASLDICKAAKDGTILTCSFRNNRR